MNISVIIPTFNRAGFILKTIESALNQTKRANEIIIIDDGSTDNTKQILQPLIDLNKIIYKYQKNNGVSSARNLGINLSSNNWLAFLDSDDIWHEEKLEKQIEFHKQNQNILFSHTDELWKFNDKIIKQKKHQQKPQGFCFEENIDSCKIGASTVFLHKSILNDIGLFDETLIACEDYDLWLRILLKYELGLISEKLITKFAGHSGQLSFDTPLMDTFRIEALKKHLDSDFKIEVKKELLKKYEILIKGAKKHNNSKILKQYTKELRVLIDGINRPTKYK